MRTSGPCHGAEVHRKLRSQEPVRCDLSSRGKELNENGASVATSTAGDKAGETHDEGVVNLSAPSAGRLAAGVARAPDETASGGRQNGHMQHEALT